MQPGMLITLATTRNHSRRLTFKRLWHVATSLAALPASLLLPLLATPLLSVARALKARTRTAGRAAAVGKVRGTRAEAAL